MLGAARVLPQGPVSPERSCQPCGSVTDQQQSPSSRHLNRNQEIGAVTCQRLSGQVICSKPPKASTLSYLHEKNVAKE